MLSRIYFNTVFGALGGLLGWMLFSIFSDKTTGQGGVALQNLLDGGLVGGGIGYLVVSVEAIRDRSWVRFVRLATYGVLLGGVGGAIGMLLGEQVNFLLVSGIGAGGGVLRFVATVVTRGLGFLFLGAAVGASEGIAARSLGKFSYGTLGGTLGGFLGGAFFGVVYLSVIAAAQKSAQTDPDGLSWAPAFAGAAGYVVMGACIGALSALVKGVFQPASIKVMRGWQEGREYPLDKNETSVGRDEHVDVALFRDMKVEKRHVFIRRNGTRYVLHNNGAPAENTRVNDVPVPQMIELRDGDRIQLGNVLLCFQMRAAQNRARPGRAAPAPAGAIRQ